MNHTILLCGELIDAGQLEIGRGLTLLVDGKEISIVGLTVEEVHIFGRRLGEKVYVQIRTQGAVGVLGETGEGQP